MDNKIIENEKRFCKEYKAIADKLIGHYNSLEEIGDINFDDNIISKAILIRLISYYASQNDIKKFLGKRYVTAGADFFVETILFYLKLIIEKFAPNYEVHSERSIERKRGALRPDISIWKGEEVIAIIECKTQLGWNRDNWEEDFSLREKKLQSIFPRAKAYLVVMSLENWAGFGGSNSIGKNFFALSKYWPGNINEIKDDVIETSIEGLYKDILKYVNDSERD